MTMLPQRVGIQIFLVWAWIAFAFFTSSPTYAQSQIEPLAVAFAPSETQQAQFDALRAAYEHGLDPADYDVTALEDLASDGTGPSSDRFSARLETAFRLYATHVSQGRLSPLADPDWHIPYPSAAREPSASEITDIDRLPPPHADYQRLSGAMLRYQAIREKGGWTTTPRGPRLTIGMRHPHVEFTRNRLRITGDYDTTTQADTYVFGNGLDVAVRRFQARHGLHVNGSVDDRTREAMNVPVDARIRQLAIAMERWRWLPRSLGREYVWVNAAEATLKIVNDGIPVLSMRTIVGHSTRPTPSLQSEIRRIVFNPTWSVPYSIATQDLLPKLRNGADFLSRNGFRVYTGSVDDVREIDPEDIDWSKVSAENFPYRFVQRPGPTNSLGRIKVVFNNPYDIYIHDTPSKGLFGLRTRTFSSGCVRLEQATEFANNLLASDRNWSEADTFKYLDDDRTQGVNLQSRIPIYVVYITSWVSEDGRANFRRDLYRRDEAVEAALLSDATSAETLSHATSR